MVLFTFAEEILNMNIETLYKTYQACPAVLIDSRKQVDGGIFFGLKGEHQDGSIYAAKAIENGCDLAIVSHARYVTDANMIAVEDPLRTLQALALFHRKQWNIPVVALTGTNGKTTTKELMSQVLSAKFKVGYTQGNLNNHIGVPLTLLNMPHDMELAIVEMGANKPGDINELCHIALPTHGLITNIGKAHLEGFGSIDGVLATKCELFHFLEAHNGVGFINAEDQRIVSYCTNNTMKKIFFNTEKGIWTAVPEQKSALLSVELRQKEQVVHLNSMLTGTYNAYNIGAAAAIGVHFGMSLQQIANQVEKYKPTNNRSQLMQTPKNELVVDAYNANPSSVGLAIAHFAKLEVPGRSKVIILGDMFELGDQTLAEHQRIVDELSKQKGVDIILVGTAYGATKFPEQFLHFANTERLLQYLEEQKIENKLILIKGSRGMALERCLPLL